MKQYPGGLELHDRWLALQAQKPWTSQNALNSLLMGKAVTGDDKDPMPGYEAGRNESIYPKIIQVFQLHHCGQRSTIKGYIYIYPLVLLNVFASGTDLTVYRIQYMDLPVECG